MWSGDRLTKIQTSARPDHVLPDVWKNASKAEQKARKQDWVDEKRRSKMRAEGEKFICWSGRQRVWRDNSESEEKVGGAGGSVHAAQEEKSKPILLSGNWSRSWSTQQSSQDKLRLCSGVSWIHRTANGTDSSEMSRRPHRSDRGELYEQLQFATQFHSHAESDEHSGRKGISGKRMEIARDNSILEDK